MEPIRKLVETVNRLVRPQSHPLGLRFYEQVEDLPQGAVRPRKYGIRISLCQWTTLSRRWGREVAVTADDINCTPCLAALGLRRLDRITHLTEYFVEMGYFANAELAERVAKELDPIAPGTFRALGMFPLEGAATVPDVVLIYGTPAQMARLAAAYLYHYGEPIESKTTGFGLSCLSAVKPHLTGRPALVHPGRGERILAGTDECEMFLAFPASFSESLADGLLKTQAKGTRYPVQSYMHYEPPVLEPLRRLGEKLGDV